MAFRVFTILVVIIIASATIVLNYRGRVRSLPNARHSADVPIQSRPIMLATSLIKQAEQNSLETLNEQFVTTFEMSNTPAQAFNLIRAEWQYAEQSTFRVQPEVIAECCNRFAARWQDSDLVLECELLSSRIWLRAGNRESATAAFIRHLEATARFHRASLKDLSPEEMVQAVDEHILSALLLECERLIARNQNGAAFDYLLIATSEFSGSESANAAKIKMTKYFVEAKRTDEAVAALRSVINETTSESIKSTALKTCGDLLLNSGNPELALNAYEELLEHSCDPVDFGYVVFHRGLLAYCRGPSSYAAATESLEKLLRECPEHLYVENAQQLLEIMQQNVAVRPPAPPANNGVSKNRRE